MDMENAFSATGSQVSAVSYISLSAFNMSDAHVRVNELYTAKECNDFCEMLEELIFNSSNNCDSVSGLEELRIINNISWICIRCARKANLLLAKEHHEELKAIYSAKQAASPASTPGKSSGEIGNVNSSFTPIKCKRTSKSPDKGTAKKSKPNEELIDLSNSFSAIAPAEDNNEDIIDDTAPSTEEGIKTLQAPVEDPFNVDMNDEVQENSDEPQLADNASRQTSLSTEDIQPKKRTPPIVIDEQYNTPGLLLEISEVVGKKLWARLSEASLKCFPRILMPIGKSKISFQ
ncbi:hypothetical protein TNCV_2214851 [Trichonephila clavipes]|nr:hypothetical protein TNCV_2214851 [Trichonephila clavipes]